eukprot:gene9795-2120_t
MKNEEVNGEEKLEELQIAYNELLQKYVDLKKENYNLKGQIKGLGYLKEELIEENKRLKTNLKDLKNCLFKKQ